MDEKLLLAIKTNLYTGNFERELMAYVFGYDADGYGYAYGELEDFSYEMGEVWREKFMEFLDQSAYEQSYNERCCYEIDSYPGDNESHTCDSILIGVKKPFTKEVSDAIVQRLNAFCDRYTKRKKEELKILAINYYKRNIEINKAEDLSFDM